MHTASPTDVPLRMLTMYIIITIADVTHASILQTSQLYAF